MASDDADAPMHSWERDSVDGDELACVEARKWCPGPSAVKRGDVPCFSCFRAAERWGLKPSGDDADADS